MEASSLASAEHWLSVIGSAKLVAAFFVGIGVVIAFGSDWVARPLERIVAAARAERLAELNTEAESLKQEIAKAIVQAAEANKIAEQERLTRVKLEAQLASRLLTSDQVNNLSLAIQNLHLKNKTVKITRLDDREAYAYADSIIFAVHNAGLNPAIEAMSALPSPRYGLQVTPELKAAFDSAGITADILSSLPHRLMPGSEIFVGLKPPPF